MSGGVINSGGERVDGSRFLGVLDALNLHSKILL